MFIRAGAIDHFFCFLFFFKLHGLNSTDRNQGEVTRMEGSWAVRHYTGCRYLTHPTLALTVGAVSPGLVSITLPVPLLGSVHERLTLASGVLGSGSLVLALRMPSTNALKIAFSPRLPSPEDQSWDTYFSMGAHPNG